MAGFDDTYKLITKALMGRPNGSEIQPEEHQAYALNMLNYIRSLELLSNAPFIGIANTATMPIQPDNSRACYIAGVGQDRTAVFRNFRDQNGNRIAITTGEMEGCLMIFLWNTQYWSVQKVSTNIISSAEQAYFLYNLTIRKTYASKAAMDADVSAPVGNDGKNLKVGEIASVHNDNNAVEDAVYSWEGDAWRLQTKLSAVDSRMFDGGRADSHYGGARNINCGSAQG